MSRQRNEALWTGAVAALCALLLAACSSVPRQLTPPRVQLVSLSLLEASVDHQRFELMFSVENPNEFDIPIAGLEYSARLSGQGVLIGQSFEPATLPARGTETLSVELTTELVSSFASMLAVVQGPEDAIPYELNGVLRVAGGLERRVRFSHSGRVPLSSTTGARR